MSWASHRTREMATTSPAGRHRRRGPGPVALVAAGALLVVAVALAMLSPTLLGWPPPSPSEVGAPSTVARAGGSVTASPGGSAGNAPGEGSPTAAPPTSPALTTPGEGGGPRTESDGLAALEQRVFELTNAERAKDGCPALRMDDSLQTAARMHSADMVNSGYFGHTSPDGRDPGRRLADAGYNTGRGWAENIARGYPTVEAVMAGWMDSAGHRANILNCSMKAIGVGAARAGNGRTYWTQDFGGR